MAQQVINIGSTANDGSGDPLRQCFIKINSNFTELYSTSATGSNFDLTANDIEATNQDGDINLIPNGTGSVRIVDDSVTIATARTIPSAIGSDGDLKGMIAWDANYVYVCTADYDGATSIWRRSALSSW